MAIRFKRGVRGQRGMGGDQPGCSLLELGVFKPQCWCLDHPALCSPDQYKAAVGWAYPGDIYVPLSVPPVPGAPASNLPPASGEAGQQTVDQLLSDQMAAWKVQNQQTMSETAANLESIDTSVTNLVPSGTNWVLIAAVGAGVLVLGSMLAGGSPRRYGR